MIGLMDNIKNMKNIKEDAQKTLDDILSKDLKKFGLNHST